MVFTFLYFCMRCNVSSIVDPVLISIQRPLGKKAITIYRRSTIYHLHTRFYTDKNPNKVKYHICLYTSPPNLVYDREPNKGTNVQQLWHSRRSIFLISKRTHVVQLYFYFLQLCKMITCQKRMYRKALKLILPARFYFRSGAALHFSWEHIFSNTI